MSKRVTFKGSPVTLVGRGLKLGMQAPDFEEQGHHPSFFLSYNKLKITLTTHVAGGLTENDFIMAQIIDELGG